MSLADRWYMRRRRPDPSGSALREAAPAFLTLQPREHTFLAITGIVMADFFVALLVYNNSSLLPGNWSPLLTAMLIYVALGLFAMIIFVWRTHPARGVKVPQIDPGQFLIRFAGAAGLTTLGMIFVLGHYGVPVAIPGSVQLQDVVFIGLFVAPIEEMVFRLVLPLRVGWFIPAIVLFVFFHLGAYTAAGLSYGTATLGVAFLEVAFLGGLLWFINSRFGYGAAVGVHAAYDLVVLGAVSGLRIAAMTLGLVAI